MAACSSGSPDGEDSGTGDAGTQPDTSMPMDASMPQDAADASDAADAADAAPPFEYDGAVPTAGAILFADASLMGKARLVTSDVEDLDVDGDTTSSIIVADGYVLYGTSDVEFGGDLSDPYVGPVTVNDLAALADTWSSVIVRPASEPRATVYRNVGGNPKVYPLGRFPSLGATNDVIDGLVLPDGVTLEGYDDADFTGTFRGPYVGPLDAWDLPWRDVWSSLVIRRSNAADRLLGDVRMYEHGNFTGTMLVLTPGQYRDLGTFPGVRDFKNYISSVRSRDALCVFGFGYADYGGSAFGPYVGDVTQLAENDDWDSVVIQRTTDPIVTVYYDGNFAWASAANYPVVDVPNLQNRSNQIDGVVVPEGYVVHAFSHPNYGGTTGPAWIHGAGMHGTQHDDWDSFVVRRVSDPTVTLYFGVGMTNPRVYPLGDFRALSPANDQIRGADVPCGVRIRAHANANHTGTEYVVTGPASVAAVPGTATWDSMYIERVACTN